MKDKFRDEIAAFRYAIISELVAGITTCPSKNAFFRLQSEKEWLNPVGDRVKIPEKTIESWFYKYQKYGFDGLRPKNRNDIGKVRKITEELGNIIAHYIENKPYLRNKVLYDELIKNEYITQKTVSYCTVNNFINRYKVNNSIAVKGEMFRYELPYINDVWCCDTTHTIHIWDNGEKKKVYIIGIIDDASRLIVGCQGFFNDNYVNFMTVLKKAISTYGKPKVLNLDNGSPYKNKQLSILCAKLGISQFHNKIRYGQGIMWSF